MKSSLDFLMNKNLFVRKKTGEDIRKFYNFEQIIGKGAYGICYKVRMIKAPYKERIVKLLLKSKIKEPSLLVNQVGNIRDLDHPSIIKIYEIFEDQKSVAIVMDYCEGGELFDLIDQRGPLNESEARHIFRQMLRAVKYMHEKHIAHRDLKPENFMMLKRKSLEIVLIDFGMSFRWKKNMHKQLGNSDFSITAGTAYYMAPEVIRTIFDETSYSEKCDIWSLGIILYTMLAAYPPFDGEDYEEIFRGILDGQLNLESEDWKVRSFAVKDLIFKLLTTQQERLTFEEIENHEWMQTSDNPEIQLNKKKPVLKFDKISQFSKTSKLKMLTSSFIASQLSAKDTEAYTKIFRQIDSDSSGELSLSEINQYFKKNKESFKISDLNKALKSLDTDKNGKISYNEFVACCLESTILHNESYLKYVFESLDQDNNGKISASEFRKVLENNGSQLVRNSDVNQLIKECDEDGDGEINLRELMKAVNRTF